MRQALGLLLVMSLPLGCASTAPLGAPEARSTPPTMASPSGAAAPIPAAPSSPPLPPVLQVSPRINNEETAVGNVNSRLARAGELAAQVVGGKLGTEQQEMLSGLKDFISKATEALKARDIPRAQLLADKASRLADDLALTLKRPRPTP